MNPWTIKYLPDPLGGGVAGSAAADKGRDSRLHSTLAHVRVPIESLLLDPEHRVAFSEGKRTACVALADYAARRIAQQQQPAAQKEEHQQAQCFSVLVQPLDRATISRRHHHRLARKVSPIKYPPYVFQRTDIWSSQSELNIIVRVIVSSKGATTQVSVPDEKKSDLIADCDEEMDGVVEKSINAFLIKLFHPQTEFAINLLRHVACVELQQRIRAQLASIKAVAFVSDGAILPRKSGASSLPMCSPPAVPFQAPLDSPMSRTIVVDMGHLRPFVPLENAPSSLANGPALSSEMTLSGLCVPEGISLIVGGGYHGKSTLLRTIAAGVYDKIPGDGREFCVTVNDAVSVRAEDGRYVNNCNISAFISGLPTPPGVEHPLDTQHFSSRDASGSTSQASNVSEAVEMGATALLVDEDVSAANFMARDGRMRALVADESITPLLYRVNGLYQTHGISSIVVVGGVGDWLDVPDSVILMDKYMASDATKKARSVSYQFSYGHVQYAGRGVVHRLPWEKDGTPNPRRPSDAFSQLFDNDVAISIMEGGGALTISGGQNDDSSDTSMDDDSQHDEHLGFIDMSRCEQLLGKKAQLYGCGLCVAWVLRTAQQHPTLGLLDLLLKLEETLNGDNGMLQLFSDAAGTQSSSEQMMSGTDLLVSSAWIQLLENIGFAFCPRKHEVAMAITRMRGIELEELPLVDDGSEAAAAREAERRKRELADLWNSRRKGRNR